MTHTKRCVNRLNGGRTDPVMALPHPASPSAWRSVMVATGLLCALEPTSCAALETVDLNSATQGMTWVRPIASASGAAYFVSTTGLGGSRSCSALPKTGGYWADKFTGTNYGMYPTAYYPYSDDDSKNENWRPWSNLPPVRALKDGAVTSQLYDVTTGTPVPGWYVSVSFAKGQPVSAGPVGGRAPTAQVGAGTGGPGKAITLISREGDLTPGHIYKVATGSYGVREACWDAHGQYSGSYVWAAFASDEWSVIQADRSEAQISSFSGSSIFAGEVEDGIVLGSLAVTAKTAVGGQSAAARWDPATRVAGAGSYAGPQYNLLRSAEGAELLVGLTCPAGVWEPDPNGGLSYVASPTQTLECQITKAGTAEVRAGKYKMSIQAAVRTP